MPFGRLSPVSETDSESLHSGRTDSVDLRPRPLNFSRPKPHDRPSSQAIQRDLQYAASTSSSSSNTTSGGTRGVGAFYEAPPPDVHELPTEPRFEDDSDHDADSVTPSTRSTGSDLVWDADAGELRSKRTVNTRRGSDFDAQRCAAPRRPQNPYTRNGSVATESELPLIAELPGDEPPAHVIAQQKQQIAQQKQDQQEREDTKPTFDTFLPPQMPRIVKHISVDQQSERAPSISSDTGTETTHTSAGGRAVGWEDSRSQRTASASEQGGGSGGSEWKSSEYDVSGLSDKKLAKLKKKGINPQLYMEMKAARGGKGKLVGPLVGNTYIG